MAVYYSGAATVIALSLVVIGFRFRKREIYRHLSAVMLALGLFLLTSYSWRHRTVALPGMEFMLFAVFFRLAADLERR
ncbi:MAG: hypothetical protein Q7T82_08780 [Armatimonadota bacterium]|nr:hypothetical protein [Armatimonadota bacterium]